MHLLKFGICDFDNLVEEDAGARWLTAKTTYTVIRDLIAASTGGKIADDACGVKIQCHNGYRRSVQATNIAESHSKAYSLPQSLHSIVGYEPVGRKTHIEAAKLRDDILVSQSEWMRV